MKLENMAMEIFFQFWSGYAQISDYHKQWARENVHPIRVKRLELLHKDTSPQRNIYFVCRGIIAFLSLDESIHKRKIESIALVHNILKTTNHLYSNKPRVGQILALRSGIVLEIPYEHVKPLKNRDQAIDILFNVLASKESRQQKSHISILLSKLPIDRYKLFREQLPYIHAALTQQEQADYLGISRRTLQECQYFFLKSLNR